MSFSLPEDYAFDPDSGIDTDANLYRSALKKAIVGVIKLFPDGYLDFVQHLFATVTPIERFAVSDWRDAEAVLTLLFYFGDGCNVNLGTNPFRDRFTSLLVDLFSSEIIVKHYHFSVLLVAMDIISRYQPLLAPLETVRYPILTIFVTGLNSNRERSRDRAVSSLARFVASIKEGIIPYQQGILDAVQVFMDSIFELEHDRNPHSGRFGARWRQCDLFRS